MKICECCDIKMFDETNIITSSSKLSDFNYFLRKFKESVRDIKRWNLFGTSTKSDKLCRYYGYQAHYNYRYKMLYYPNDNMVEFRAWYINIRGGHEPYYNYFIKFEDKKTAESFVNDYVPELTKEKLEYVTKIW